MNALANQKRVDNTPTMDGGKIRYAPYAKRLSEACDNNPHCPPLNFGRLTWLADQMHRRGDKKIPIETVRKWLSGETRPRPERNELVSKILGVTPEWLYHGVTAAGEIRREKVRSDIADGWVNVIAGLIQMDGGAPAFPQADDRRAERDRINLYAIIKAATYSFNVVAGEEVEGNWRFFVPDVPEGVIVLGVVRIGCTINIIEISDEMVSSALVSEGAFSQVDVDPSAKNIRLITDFKSRI